MSEAQRVVLSHEGGARAVELAREAVEGFVLNGQREQPGSMRDSFYNRTGALVRLESRGGRLRGSAGDHESNRQLGQSIVEGAIQAASDSSCRSEVEPAELSGIRISVCIVSDVHPTTDPVNDVEIGTHGVAVEGDGQEACIFPTVPLDQGWSSYEYVDRTCRKAGLASGAWENEDVTVRLFEGQIFRERAPEGEIEHLTS